MVVTCNDSARVATFEEWFDVVAVDAPCSGEGMFRKSDEACEQWSEANVAMCAERQWEILENAFRVLKPGGVLMYSTCTFNRTEDEEVVARAMEAFGDELEAVDDIAVGDDWGVVTGREGATSRKSQKSDIIMKIAIFAAVLAILALAYGVYNEWRVSHFDEPFISNTEIYEQEPVNAEKEVRNPDLDYITPKGN
jgi:16S rRNA C967 or C1407 C5-methylase (RsmB/RsmF family)